MGLKNYVLSGIVGIIYNLKTHTGSIMPCPGQPDLQALGNIVLELVQHVPRFNGTSFILTTGRPVFYLKRHL